MAKIFLTFDDGPEPGTDDVIQVLEEKKIRGTLFMVGKHMPRTEFTKKWFKKSRESPFKEFVEVANHSESHANNKYKEFYKKKSDEILADFETATKNLKITASPVPTRLPGRNSWRLPGIVEDVTSDAKPGADVLSENGYNLYGWDIEWRMDGEGKAIESVEQMVNQVRKAIDGAIETRKKGKIVLLTHDKMFKKSTQGRSKLEEFIDHMVKEGHEFGFVSDY